MGRKSPPFLLSSWKHVHPYLESDKPDIKSFCSRPLPRQRAPRSDTAASAADILYGTPLRIPGLCFQDEQSAPRSTADQLDLARANVAAFSPQTLDLRKFRYSPFVAKTLRTAKFVYVRDDRLAKPTLAPKYLGPFPVKEKIWQNNTFIVDLGKTLCQSPG